MGKQKAELKKISERETKKKGYSIPIITIYPSTAITAKRTN